jgi:hypothetical protein
MLDKRRRKDFTCLFYEIENVINNYIEECHLQQKNGWKKEAINFKLYKLAPLRTSYSLLSLKNTTEKFSKKLISNYNNLASYFWAEQNINLVNKLIGSGSQLKKRLDVIIAKIDPLSPDYVIDDIKNNYLKNKFNHHQKFFQLPSSVLQRTMFESYTDYLSLESQAVLPLILESSDLHGQLWEAAINIGYTENIYGLKEQVRRVIQDWKNKME